MSKTVLSISLDRPLVARLERTIQETERPRSWLVSQAIEEYLDELEDLELAYRRYRNPQGRRLTERALRKRLGLSH